MCSDLLKISGKHISGSPFAVDVISGPGGNASTAHGDGIYTAKAGVLSVFTIQARDLEGNPTADAGTKAQSLFLY